MASINVRNGRLQADFRYKGRRCRELTRYTDTAANRKKLEKILERMEAEILLGTFVYRNYFPKSARADLFDELESKLHAARQGANGQAGNIPTFAEFTEIWLSEKQVEWRDSHYRTVTGSLKSYALPFFGDKKLSDITKAEVLQFRTNLAKEPLRKDSPLKASTVNKVITPIRMIMNEAAERYDINSPFRGVKSLKIQRTDIEPFSLEEVSKFLTHVRKDFQAYYTVRFFTGMRTGEIDGLRWKYIDFERRQILIRETVVNTQMTYTKNDGSQREIHMSQPVFDALQAQREVTGDKEFVFCNRDGNPLYHRNVTRRVWHPTLRYLGIKRRPPYQTRHTAATLWLAAGETPEWIARQMGHTTTEMLFRVYSRYVPNLTRQDGSAFDRLLASELNQTAKEEEKETADA
ncbi:site-specific integrase [Pseudomonas sp. F1_0610]|uniref:Arm DNA-binding domain-containing protein n=1 Tax=Pseudomonas sp. F1_0610 TaxID=3114284 RepID=UPI0039C0D900